MSEQPAASSGSSGADPMAIPADDPERTKSPRRAMCAAILVLEAIAFGMVTPVLIQLTDLSMTASLVIGLGLAVACVLCSGLLRREWGYLLGWVIQVAALAVGLLVTMMFVLGGVFALLWGMAYFLGRKIERERADAFAAYDARHAGP